MDLVPYRAKTTRSITVSTAKWVTHHVNVFVLTGNAQHYFVGQFPPKIRLSTQFCLQNVNPCYAMLSLDSSTTYSRSIWHGWVPRLGLPLLLPLSFSFPGYLRSSGDGAFSRTLLLTADKRKVRSYNFLKSDETCGWISGIRPRNPGTSKFQRQRHCRLILSLV